MSYVAAISGTMIYCALRKNELPDDKYPESLLPRMGTRRKDYEL